MKLPLGKAVVAGLAFAVPLLAQAAVIHSDFHHISGSHWTVDFTVIDDGTPANIAAFTTFFSETTYSNLTLNASPATWDSIVIQPDPGLPDEGFLDSIVLNPANALTPGQSLSGFEVGFTLLPGRTPGALAFEIYNPSNFNVLFSGQTIALVPEPSSLLLALLGISTLAGFGSRRRSAVKEDRMKTTHVGCFNKPRFSAIAVASAFLLAGGASMDANADATVVSLIKVSETRIGRTVYDYVFKVQVQNGIDPLNNVVATLAGAGPGTTIMDGSAVVGNMAANAVAIPTDTITLRQDRTFEFDAKALVWTITGKQPFNVAKATCVGPNDKPETALQGQVPAAMRTAGFNGFSCNLELRSQAKGDGASWQTASFGDCMYYDTSQTTANRTHRGVWVMDYSNTSNIVPTAYLTSTAMIDPWESLKVNERRQLLGATQANGGSGGPTLDLYDLSQNCRSPQLISSTAVGNGTFGDLKLPAGQNLKGHEGNFSPDGLTYYGGDRGTPVKYTAIDISNTLTPKLLATVTLPSGVTTHGLSFSADGNRAYASQAGVLGNTSTANLATRPAINGLIIFDVSDIQQRRPNPQMRVVSKLLWNDGGQMQHSIPITVGGKSYVVVVDELGTGGGSTNGWTAACNQGIAGHGMARIIDISNETAPKLTSLLALEVHDPVNCAATLPDLVGLTSFGYDSHYCTVDQNENATTLACGYFNSGIRVFDIRRPDHPREIAYYNPAGVKTSSPGSNHNGTGFKAGGPDFCSAQIHFDKVKRELWTTCQDNGALALRFAEGVWPFTN